MDHETFDIRGRWEIDRGPQRLAYDAWWHFGHDTMVTSEWGHPATFENGLVPEVLLGGQYGHKLHFWDLHSRKQGGIAFDPNFLVEWPKTHRPHQVRLEGGDCSSDSYCYP